MSYGKNEARSTNFILSFAEDKDMSLSVLSSNVADVNFPATHFPTNYKDAKVPTNKIELDPVVVQFVVNEYYEEWLYIYKWILVNKNRPDDGAYRFKTLELISKTTQARDGVRFIYRDAWPVQLEGMQYATNSEGSQIITCTATFEFNIFAVVDKDGNVINEEYYVNE